MQQQAGPLLLPWRLLELLSWHLLQSALLPWELMPYLSQSAWHLLSSLLLP